jgi:hypothetical protein
LAAVASKQVANIYRPKFESKLRARAEREKKRKKKKKKQKKKKKKKRKKATRFLHKRFLYNMPSLTIFLVYPLANQKTWVFFLSFFS